MSDKRYRLNKIFITVLAIFILFGFNGNISTLGLDEAMYMTSSYEMIATDNYLMPQYNYEPFYDKPPMVYWLQTISYNLFDDFLGSKRITDTNEKTKTLTFGHKEITVPQKTIYDTKLMLFRLPASLTCLIFIWLIIFYGNKLFSRKCGIYSAYVFLLCPLTLALGKMAIMDMILSFFIFISLITALLVYIKKINKNYIILSWIFMALAFMTKGPISVICIGIVYLSFLIIKKNIKNLFTIPNLIGLIFFILIVSPWFIIMQIHSQGDFWYEFFVHQNIERAAGKDFGHNFPIYSYIFIILIGMIPWSVYLIPSILKSKLGNQNNVSHTYLSVWVIAIFLFFTALISKLPGYIYPLFAPSALLIGNYFAEFKFSKGIYFWGALSSFVCFILGTVFSVGLFFLNYQTLFAKIIFLLSGISLIILSIYSFIRIAKKQNPFKTYTITMAVFSVLIVIGLFAVTSNPCNTIDEIDAKYDLGTSSYNIAREFNIRNLPEHVEIYACDLSPLWISYPLIFERQVHFIKEKDMVNLAKQLPDHYLIIGKDKLPSDIKGEKIYNNPLFVGKKHKYVFIKNY